MSFHLRVFSAAERAAQEAADRIARLGKFDVVTPQLFGCQKYTEADALNGIENMIDDTARLNLWLAWPGEIDMGPYWYRISEELYTKAEGRMLNAHGRGTFTGDRDQGFQGVVGAISAFVIHRDDRIPPRRRTRYRAPKTAQDEDDPPISVMFENHGEGATFANFALLMDCDYTDMRPENRGAEVDVAFFNGCRGGVFACLTSSGYFDIANELWDVTGGGPSLDTFTAPDGLPYPQHINGGADQCRTTPRAWGGRKQVWLMGALESDDGSYYDVVTDTIKTNQGGRGGSGGSDFTMNDRWMLYGPEHHSGYLFYEPTMNVDTEDTWLIAACLVIDGRRGSNTQGRIQRMLIANGRIRTNETRIWFDRAARVDLEFIHSEPSKGEWRNSEGLIVNIAAYGVTSYGPIALRPTSGTGGGCLDIHARGFWGTDPVEDYTVKGVPSFTYADKYVGIEERDWVPEFVFLDSVTVTHASGKTVRLRNMVWCEFTITWENAVVASDGSVATLQGLYYDRAPDSTFAGNIDYLASTGIIPTGGFQLACPTNTGSEWKGRLHFVSDDGTKIEYDDGQFQTSGTLKGAFWYRTDKPVY